MRQRDQAGERAPATTVCRRRWLQTAAAVLGGPLLARPLPARPIAPADTSRQRREQSIAELPLAKLTPAARQKVVPVVQRPTLFRRMPLEQVHCHPGMFIYLVRYPEVVVNMWDLMGATKLKLQRVGEYLLDCDDGAGTVTRLELLYGSREQHLLYAEGEYSGPLFRRQLTGRCVLYLQSQYGRDEQGKDVVTASLDVFLTLDNVGADLVARTFQPMVGRTADHNFAESARFVGQVSEQSDLNPAGMQRLSKRLTKVSPAVRLGFAATVRQCTGAAELAADVEEDEKTR